MGRSAEAGAVVATASAATPADAAMEAVKPGSSGAPPAPASGLPPRGGPASSSHSARRRARVDAACAAVFRTKLLRQFAALLYKNR